MIYLPPNIFSNLREIAFEGASMGIVVIELDFDPHYLDINQQNMIESNNLLLNIIGANGKILNITNLTTPIEFNIPYSGTIKTGRNLEFLSCSWYDQE